MPGQAISVVRRIGDVALACITLLISTPALAVIALLIKATSPGPVLYSQVRVGQAGRRFRILKLRTMALTADRSGSSVTLDADPRITRLGSALRNWKVDELPQLWNVLRGDMSIVGPRPDVPEIVAGYSEGLRQILNVRPGMTSYASLMMRCEARLLARARNPEGVYRAILVPYKIKLDLVHVSNNSVSYDLRILLKTGWLLTGGRCRVSKEEQSHRRCVLKAIREFERRRDRGASPGAAADSPAAGRSA